MQTIENYAHSMLKLFCNRKVRGYKNELRKKRQKEKIRFTRKIPRSLPPHLHNPIEMKQSQTLHQIEQASATAFFCGISN